MTDDPRSVFAKHRQSGKIAVFYEIKIYCTQY